MHRMLPLPLVVASQALPYEVLLEPLPSTSRLSPADLAQAYRAWRFGTRRAATCYALRGRARR